MTFWTLVDVIRPHTLIIGWLLKAVWIGSEVRDTRLGAAEHCELRGFGVEIDDSGRFAFHVLLRLLMDAAPP
jgi:hypothetical protein